MCRGYGIWRMHPLLGWGIPDWIRSSVQLDSVVPACMCCFLPCSVFCLGFLGHSRLRSFPAHCHRFKFLGNRKHYDAAVQPRDWRQAWPPQVEREAHVAVLDSGPPICFLLQGPPPPPSARPATPGPTLPPQVQGEWGWGGWYCRVAGWNETRAGGFERGNRGARK